MGYRIAHHEVSGAPAMGLNLKFRAINKEARPLAVWDLTGHLYRLHAPSIIGYEGSTRTDQCHVDMRIRDEAGKPATTRFVVGVSVEMMDDLYARAMTCFIRVEGQWDG